MSNGYNIAVDCVDKHPADLPALVCVDWDPATKKIKSRLFSFGELQEFTNRFARGVAALGFARGDRILLQLPNGFEFPVAFIGAVKVGLIPVPVSPLLTRSELDYLVKDSGAAMVVEPSLQGVHSDMVSPSNPCPRVPVTRFDNPSTSSGRRLTVSGAGLAMTDKSARDFAVHPTRPDDPAYWLYTSGTEGVPKGVIHAHRSIPAHDSRVKLWLDLKPGDVVFNTSSLNWSYALTCGLLDVWRHGNQTVIYNGSLRPELLCEVIAEQKVTVFMSVPGIYRRLVESHRAKSFKKVRVCLSAGEKLPEEIRERFREATGITIREGLGMTEHSVYLVQPVDKPVVPGSCGKPLPGTRIAILRERVASHGSTSSPCPTAGHPELVEGWTEAKPDEVGVIASHRSCEGLMLGYHDFPLQGDWFLSDDLAYRDEAGNFFFVGRRDDVITAGGYRISPMEVESVLNQHPAIEESAVVGREIEAAKTIVCAFVVCRKEIKKPTKEEVTFHAASKLAKYKVPREIVFTDRLPKTESGKIRRKELRTNIGSA